MAESDVTTLDAANGFGFDDALAEIRQPFVIFDGDQRLTACNRAYAQLHRNEDGSCILYPSISFQEIMAWRVANGFYAAGSQPMNASSYYNDRGEVAWQLRDERWMYIERTNLPDGRHFGLWIEITELKRSEAQLREAAERLARSEEQFRRAERIAHVGSDMRDFATNTTYWSEETYRIFGVRPDNFVATRQNVLAIMHPDDRPAMAAHFARSIQDPAPARHEFRIIRPDGVVRVIARESEVVVDAAGKPLRRIGTVQDITEERAQQERERALQHALRAANADLERRVAQRTVELERATEELVRKEKLSAIGQITATVAHELRNPLSAIKNTIYAMKSMKDAPPATERLVARMERSLDRCNQIISELLEYSRVQEVHCAPCAVEDWLDEVLSEQELPQNVALKRAFSAGAVAVALDLERFRRVVINLVENAVQAMVESGEACPAPAVTVATRLIDDGLEIEVADNGPGMAPDTLARIFEPLFSTKRTGTGLGLPTVKQIVEQHRGTIEIESAPGEGTSAFIRLPLHRASEAA